MCPASAAHLSPYPPPLSLRRTNRFSCLSPPHLPLTSSPAPYLHLPQPPAPLHRRALRYYHDMQQQGVPPDTQTVNSLINAFAKVGDVERAFRVAASMERRALTPTVVTYAVYPPPSPADPPLTLSPRR